MKRMIENQKRAETASATVTRKRRWRGMQEQRPEQTSLKSLFDIKMWQGSGRGPQLMGFSISQIFL